MKTLEERKTYWTNRLSGAPAALALPWDQERPPASSFLRETVSKALAAHVWPKLSAFAAKKEVSVSSVLMAAFATVLSRYTGQLDLLIGSLLSPPAEVDKPTSSSRELKIGLK